MEVIAISEPCPQKDEVLVENMVTNINPIDYKARHSDAY